MRKTFGTLETMGTLYIRHLTLEQWVLHQTKKK